MNMTMTMGRVIRRFSMYLCHTSQSLQYRTTVQIPVSEYGVRRHRHSPEPSPATDPPLMRHGFDTRLLTRKP